MGKRKNKNGNGGSSSDSSKNHVAALSKTKMTAIFSDHLLLSSKATHKFGTIQCLSLGTVWIQHNFLSPAECQAWMDWSNDGDKSLWEYTSQRATRYMAHRECFRIQRDDNRVSQTIFDRLQQSGMLDCVQRDLSFPKSNYRPVACNPNIRLYRYDKGMYFGKHVDGSNTTAMGQTEITLLIYLSACQGGATRFYRPNDSSSFAFEPQVGAILLHVHGDRCLEHEADPVLAGVKFVLRSDVCYRYT